MTEPAIRPLTVGEYRSIVALERAENAKPENDRELLAVQVRAVSLATVLSDADIESSLSPGDLADLYQRILKLSFLKTGEETAAKNLSTSSASAANS